MRNRWAQPGSSDRSTKTDLGEVELPRDLLHPRRRQTRGLGKYRQLIAGEGRVGEDVGREEPVAHALASAIR